MEMSEGGVCLLMDAELGLGDTIELEFTPPYSGKPIRVRSEVCNRTEYRYGVKFIPEGNEERSEVARLRQVLSPFEEATHAAQLAVNRKSRIDTPKPIKIRSLCPQLRHEARQSRQICRCYPLGYFDSGSIVWDWNDSRQRLRVLEQKLLPLSGSVTHHDGLKGD